MRVASGARFTLPTGNMAILRMLIFSSLFCNDVGGTFLNLCDTNDCELLQLTMAA